MTHTKPPTRTDIAIYDYMSQGKAVNSMQLFKQFGTTSHRCIIYRLRKAGYPVNSKMIYSKKHKPYAKYWVGEEGE